MEKISGILPSTSRITSVDLKSSGAVRSGTPSYGRPVGLSAPAAREIERTTAQNARAVHEQLMSRRSLDPRAQIVEKMADNFFVNRNRQVEAEPMSAIEWDANADLNPSTGSESGVKINWSNAGLGPVENDEFFIEKEDGPKSEKVAAEVPSEDLDRPAVGGYLNVEA